jgi:hypothetical protein
VDRDGRRRPEHRWSAPRILRSDRADGGADRADAPPRTRFRTESDAAHYARRADRLTVRHDDGTPVAVIEIVSPGNKDSRSAMAAFARKMANYLFHGIHVLVIDLFPPNPRNPQGVHKVIWDRIKEEDFALPADQPLTLAAYSAGPPTRAFVEPVAVGGELPDMPIFLTPDRHVPCPLAATYAQSWAVFPDPLRGPLVAPTDDAGLL